ncbi:MAG: hypothetical protein Hyperionvirus15_7 [Hyperionvirus sp.]|uniref:Uncharacterized protein n=1 Tax=Hyperionvirus sp. TaxID=2487770 RepID=A0A3G5AF22_9VIRU|nr:MAG: hypothetical protein Hyperionvirus15_7 [Hyperionvirus sp.]
MTTLLGVMRMGVKVVGQRRLIHSLKVGGENVAVVKRDILVGVGIGVGVMSYAMTEHGQKFLGERK